MKFPNGVSWKNQIFPMKCMLSHSSEQHNGPTKSCRSGPSPENSKRVPKWKCKVTKTKKSCWYLVTFLFHFYFFRHEGERERKKKYKEQVNIMITVFIFQTLQEKHGLVTEGHTKFDCQLFFLVFLESRQRCASYEPAGKRQINQLWNCFRTCSGLLHWRLHGNKKNRDIAVGMGMYETRQGF